MGQVKYFITKTVFFLRDMGPLKYSVMLTVKMARYLKRRQAVSKLQRQKDRIRKPGSFMLLF